MSEWYHNVRKERLKSKDSTLEITPGVSLSLNPRWWLETRISWSIYNKAGFLWFVAVGWRELYYSFWTWCMGKVGFLETSYKGCFQYLSIYILKDWARWDWLVYSFPGSGKTWSETSVQQANITLKRYVQTHNRSPDLMLLSSGLPFMQVGHISRNSQECPITTHSLLAPLIPVSAGTTNCFLQKTLAGMKSLSCKLCWEAKHQF